ncbi:hypothetical protein PY479_05185 [Shewanella sp. A32]|uniref:hypothetical protein n=1 Tax=Shewanella sp. A32 TaxID=3031327 RepID=UPI0023B9B358|nr:hypothetical protein [Shewanella sp. A32]MDF0533673.1 hypothetical protein [Shewanella sp. A32]
MLKELRQALLPPRVIATVTAQNADDTITAVTSSGRQYRAIGSATVGTKVYIQDGRVLGTAPDLTHYEISV